ncbi:hypothetical protein BC792_1417 [Sphingobacterium allocomposti]|uniref:PH domain-containing protein n=1 Tax=Sphingobacterium allocomposti TaxID=415956 RepID=A0A5S5CTT4_9SPHI|nr:hypothetical protein [Sphingobacterium composti Yoo et al. 2007 non Ten et al. 2007]TYP87015.1 hypothetical protein BC792_1417 [Sphingobacterium composti Yoo et al. 2007 non Ten et al. 2007]
MIIFLLWAVEWRPSTGMTVLLIFIFVTLIVPLLLIHVNHYTQDAKALTLLKDRIELYDNGKLTSIDVKEISTMLVYKSPTKFSNIGLQSFSFEDYFYLEINTLQGRKYYVSSLLSDKIDKLFEQQYMLNLIPVSTYYPIIVRS